jgi:hypothetical protein
MPHRKQKKESKPWQARIVAITFFTGTGSGTSSAGKSFFLGGGVDFPIQSFKSRLQLFSVHFQQEHRQAIQKP